MRINSKYLLCYIKSYSLSFLCCISIFDYTACYHSWLGNIWKWYFLPLLHVTVVIHSYIVTLHANTFQVLTRKASRKSLKRCNEWRIFNTKKRTLECWRVFEYLPIVSKSYHKLICLSRIVSTNSSTNRVK